MRLFAEGGHLVGAAAHVASTGNEVAVHGIGILLILCGGLVAVGLLTPVIQAIVIVVDLGRSGQWLWAIGSATMMQDPWQALLVEAAVAASLTMLGPGAYSIDARLFGREEIRIPPRRHPAGRGSSSRTPFVVPPAHQE